MALSLPPSVDPTGWKQSKVNRGDVFTAGGDGAVVSCGGDGDAGVAVYGALPLPRLLCVRLDSHVWIYREGPSRFAHRWEVERIRPRSAVGSGMLVLDGGWISMQE